MPTTAPSARSVPCRGFTLVEVIVSAGLGAMILAAILSAFLWIGRSSVSAANYVVMEQQSRRALERFGQDVRMTEFLTTLSPTQIKLLVPRAADNGSDTIFYTYDAAAQTLSRLGPDPVTDAPNTTTVLINNVVRCEFKRWLIGLNGPANSDAFTDQLQIRITVERKASAAATATNLVLSARFVLRNHKSYTTL